MNKNRWRRWVAEGMLGASLLLGGPLAAGEAAAEDAAIEALEENISRKTLSNGLEVIVLEDHSLPLVTVEMVVRNGAFTEPPEFDGLSHLYEHMFFKGNEAIPSQEAYMARQRELGMSWNGTTSTERVNYYFTLASDRFGEGMVFMRDAIRSPLFNQDELERERMVVLDEYNRNEASAGFHLRRAVDKALWYEHFSRKNTIGDREILATATREKMLTVQARYYIPNNSALFVAGDVTPAQVFSEAEALYGDWARGEDPFIKHPIPEHPPLKGNVATIVEKPVKAVTVTIALHGPDTDGDVKATYAADVFSFILSQRESQFQKVLVDSGLVLGAGVSYFTQRHTGPISLRFAATPDKVEPALKALAQELDKFADADYFADAQIETAKTLLEVDDLYGREKTSEFVHTLSFWWSSAGIGYYLGYLENLKAVQRADIERYVRAYIQGKPYVIGVLISPEDREKLGLTEDKLLQWFSK